MLHNESSESKDAVNYVFVGDPPTYPMGVPGHDVAGPIAMAKANKTNPVVFWCLDKQLKFYQDQLEKHGITVKAIEPHVESCLKDPELKEAAEQFQTIMKTLLAETRNAARDRTTVKEAFSIFLLVSNGGYFCDTNVRPILSSMSLPSFNTFNIPDQKTSANEHNPECWMMYSPPKTARAKESFRKFFSNWEKTEKMFEGQLNSKIAYPYPEKFHTCSAYDIIVAVWQPTDTKSSDYFNYVEDEDLSTATIKDLGILKRYYNTHIQDLDCDNLFIEELLKAVRDENLIQLRELLHYTLDRPPNLPYGPLDKILSDVREVLQYAKSLEQTAIRAECCKILAETIQSIEQEINKENQSKIVSSNSTIIAFAGLQARPQPIDPPKDKSQTEVKVTLVEPKSAETTKTLNAPKADDDGPKAKV